MSFDGAQLQVSYIFGTDPNLAATAEYGSDAIQIVVASAAPNTLDVATLPGSGPDVNNGAFGWASLDFGITSLRIEFPLDPSVFGPNATVSSASPLDRPYNGVRITDTLNILPAIHSVTITDQAGFTIPISAANLEVTADSIFLNMNALPTGTTQSRLVDVDTGTPGAQPSFVTLDVQFEYEALLSGDYWTGIERTATPVFITYSFPTNTPASHAGVAGIDYSSFQAFSASQKAQAVAALQQWASASGIIALEVPPGEGQINFALYDFPGASGPGSGGMAFNPFGNWNYLTAPGFTEAYFIDDTGNGVTDFSGDVFINKSNLTGSNFDIPTGLLLHEIGHALGLKHVNANFPGDTQHIVFSGLVWHDETLSPGLDDTSNTVMSYNGAAPSTLGTLDIDAIQHIYGTNAQDGSQVASYSWNAGTYELTQSGFDLTDDIMRGVSVRDIMYGDGGNDLLFGLGGNDQLFGQDGADRLFGGTGNDTLNGGAGADTFFADLFQSDSAQADVIVDFNTAEDLIDLELFGPLNFYGPASSEALGLILTDNGPGSAQLSAFWNGFQQTLTINYTGTLTAADFYMPSFGPRIVVGSSGADTMFGGLQDDTLSGGAGNDTFIGDQGADTASFASATNVSGLTIALSSGNATVLNAHGLGEVDSLLSIEGIIGSGYADTITGDEFANTITGGLGNDTLTGGAGADGFVFDATESTNNQSDIVTDFDITQDQVVFGPGGPASFESLMSAMQTSDGAGNMVLRTIWNGFTQTLKLTGAPDNLGAPTPLSAANFVFDSNTNRNVIGTANIDYVFGSTVSDTLSGGGGDDWILGDAGVDTLNGDEGDDHLLGGSGNDIMDGGANDDRLYGGIGDDDMKGGSGNDTFYVTDAGDDVFEAGSGGNDSVQVYTNWLMTAGQEIEYAHVNTGTGTQLTGNEFGNYLGGNTGNDTLSGGWGNDYIDGYLGADSMAGGLGNDTFLIDNAGDAIIEGEFDGSDTAFVSVNWVASASLYLESIRASVSGLDITGSDHNNNMFGTAGADTIRGGGGKDRLYGEAGNDDLYGGADDDAFYVRDAGDNVYEVLGGGQDQVQVYTSWIMTAGQEIEYAHINTTTSLSVAGNAHDNWIDGNAGNDTLEGGGGADYLVGAGGTDTLDGGLGNDVLGGGTAADTFIFRNTWGADKVVDFENDIDTIDLSAISDLTSLSQLTITTLADLSLSIAFTGHADTIRVFGNVSASTILDDIIL